VRVMLASLPIAYKSLLFYCDETSVSPFSGFRGVFCLLCCISEIFISISIATSVVDKRHPNEKLASVEMFGHWNWMCADLCSLSVVPLNRNCSTFVSSLRNTFHLYTFATLDRIIQ
jgi:hypothetical protein